MNPDKSRGENKANKDNEDNGDGSAEPPHPVNPEIISSKIYTSIVENRLKIKKYITPGCGYDFYIKQDKTWVYFASYNPFNGHAPGEEVEIKITKGANSGKVERDALESLHNFSGFGFPKGEILPVREKLEEICKTAYKKEEILSKAHKISRPS